MTGNYISKTLAITDKYKFISFLGLYDLPKVEGEKIYSKSNLALHEETQMLQVYVTSPNKEGVYEFFDDFPEAKLVRTARLENPKEWMVLAYPRAQIPDEAPPLDNYLMGVTENFLTNLEMEKIND